MHFEIGDAACQRLAGLLQKIDRRGAKQQETPGSLPAAAAPVYETTQVLEQARQPMDLIEYDQLVLVLGEIELRLSKLGAVRVGLEVEIDRGALFAYGERKRRLADLPRPDESDGGHVVEQFVEVGFYTALDHPCIYGV